MSRYRNSATAAGSAAFSAAAAPRPVSPEATAAPGIAAPSRGIHPYRVELPNGLVVICHDNPANPTLAIHGLVKAGALFDPPDRAGVSSFVTAMLDRGTAERTAYQQAEALESMGASLHFDSGPETLLFTANALAEDADRVLEVLADALRRPAFPSDQIEKARDELTVRVKVSNENTGFVASRMASEMLFPSEHPFHRSPMGTEESLAAIARGDLVSFHARHFAPNTVILVLVGDVRPATLVQHVSRLFSDWERNESVPPFVVPRGPAPERPLRRVVGMKGRSQVGVVYAFPGLSRNDPDYYPAMIMNYVLGGGSLQSRLMDTIRDKQGLVYGVYSNLTAGIGAGPILIRAGTNPKNTDRTAEEILRQVQIMHDEGATATELEEAVSYLTGVFPVRLETNAGVAAQLLGAELYGLGMEYIERYSDIIRAITLDQVRAAGRTYLRTAGYALGIAGSVPEDQSGEGAR
jgi:zinc protease